MLCRALTLPTFAFLSIASIATTRADPTLPILLTAGQARQVAEVLDADASALAIGKLCPADAYGRLTDKLNTQTDETAFCEREPVACAKKCVTLSSAEHCIRLALLLSYNGRVIRPVYTMRLFALACAAGDKSGCTNRASFIRNTETEGDPFLEAPLAVKQACEHRSFALSCEHDDSWGCAMLGQSFALGEGTVRDKTAARRYYARSCALAEESGAPDFEACRFAKNNLETMGKP